jgi:hypothetical protein
MSAPSSPQSNIRTVASVTADTPTSSSASDTSNPSLLSILHEVKTNTGEREDDDRTIATTIAAQTVNSDVKTEKKLKRMSELAKMRLLLPESQRFSGEGNKSIRQWINVVDDTLSELTDNDYDRAFIAKGWLVGVAQQTIINETNRRKMQGEPEMNWKAVKQCLIETFDMGNTSELAIQHLTTLKMNSSNMSSVAAYNIEWYKYLQYINTDEWDTTAITTIYINGLWSKIRMELVKIKHASRRLNPMLSAPTLMQLMKEAIEIESMIREMNHSYQSSSTASTDRRGIRPSHPSSANNRTSVLAPSVAKTPSSIKVHNITQTNLGGEAGTEDVEAEEFEQEEGKDHSLSAVSVSSSSQTSSYNRPSAAPTKKHNTQWLTLEERDKLMQMGRCFRCYKVGHTKRTCTETPATQRPNFSNLN